MADDVLRFMHALRHQEIPVSKDEKAELSSMLGMVKSEKAEEVSVILDSLCG